MLVNVWFFVCSCLIFKLHHYHLELAANFPSSNPDFLESYLCPAYHQDIIYVTLELPSAKPSIVLVDHATMTMIETKTVPLHWHISLDLLSDGGQAQHIEAFDNTKTRPSAMCDAVVICTVFTEDVMNAMILPKRKQLLRSRKQSDIGGCFTHS